MNQNSNEMVTFAQAEETLKRYLARLFQPEVTEKPQKYNNRIIGRAIDFIDHVMRDTGIACNLVEFNGDFEDFYELRISETESKYLSHSKSTIDINQLMKLAKDQFDPDFIIGKIPQELDEFYKSAEIDSNVNDSVDVEQPKQLAVTEDQQESSASDEVKDEQVDQQCEFQSESNENAQSQQNVKGNAGSRGMWGKRDQIVEDATKYMTLLVSQCQCRCRHDKLARIAYETGNNKGSYKELDINRYNLFERFKAAALRIVPDERQFGNDFDPKDPKRNNSNKKKAYDSKACNCDIQDHINFKPQK